MPKVTPFLWFDDNAEQAADFYLSIFPNARKLGGLSANGKVLTVAIELEGQPVTFLNGGLAHKLSEAFSFVITCEDQAEIDRYWTILGDGGKEINCGWIQDKFGLFWQVAPDNLAGLLRHPKAMEAMVQMRKLDISALTAAAGQ